MLLQNSGDRFSITLGGGGKMTAIGHKLLGYLALLQLIMPIFLGGSRTILAVETIWTNPPCGGNRKNPATLLS
jgi:hypothetical protein